MIPKAIDLYCGFGGWAEGFLAEGYEVTGYDIEKHDYGTGTYPSTLVLQDVLTIHGAQFKTARIIVASPPCQEPSYRAMPWKRAKALNAIGPPHLFIELFNACFRIQREASEAAGHYIPLIVENVCGAQRWVGRARWHFGSYYLWGDVPALMPITMRSPMKLGVSHRANGETNFHRSAARASKNDGGSWFNIAHNTTSGKGQNPVHQRVEESGTKQQRQDGKALGWFGEYTQGQGSRNFSSHSRARARASAEIAKIPFPLARYIAQVFKVTHAD